MPNSNLKLSRAGGKDDVLEPMVDEGEVALDKEEFLKRPKLQSERKMQTRRKLERCMRHQFRQHHPSEKWKHIG